MPCGASRLLPGHDIPLFVLGGGSNLLIRDGGMRGIVVLLRGAFRPTVWSLHSPDVAQAHVGVAYPLSRLALQLARQGWSGLEFAYGIPGTLGGAMVMNAGTHLGDMSRVLVTARVLLPMGRCRSCRPVPWAYAIVARRIHRGACFWVPRCVCSRGSGTALKL